ncbi:MAG: hypothetical protein GY820_05580, partial [Gammaproteobacteria bacterium]|nr:hypothetical protein [Gammaproteobacteria bacterium]
MSETVTKMAKHSSPEENSKRASQAQGFETAVNFVALTSKSKLPTSTPVNVKLAPKTVVITDASPALSPESQGDVPSASSALSPESQGDVPSISQAPVFLINNKQASPQAVPSRGNGSIESFGQNYSVRGRARGQIQEHRITEPGYVDPYYENDPQGEAPPKRELGPPPVPRQEFQHYGQGRPDPAREYRKIPTVLCPRFGERYNNRDFNTFEREFSQLCVLCEVPADQKLVRFMLHLEGPIQIHAQVYLDSREGHIPQYRELIDELRRSFQKTIDVDEAEHKLHGRKWNPYEMTIDEFLHDTRLLVQQAYPGEHGRWDAKIRACLCRALPIELEQIVASNTRAI